MLLALGAFALTGNAVAQASCFMPQPIQDELRSAPVVFVGTVIYTSNLDRNARVRVESVWRGPALPAYVDISGSPASSPFQATDVDRKYQPGQRYLFVPSSDRPPFEDNDCTATQPYTADLAAYAPADARTPDPATADDYAQNFAGQYWLQLAVGAGVLLSAGLIGFAVRRRAKHRT